MMTRCGSLRMLDTMDVRMSCPSGINKCADCPISILVSSPIFISPVPNSMFAIANAVFCILVLSLISFSFICYFIVEKIRQSVLTALVKGVEYFCFDAFISVFSCESFAVGDHDAFFDGVHDIVLFSRV